MEFTFFALTVEDYMDRFGIDREEVLEKFGMGTNTIIEGHLTDRETGEQHLTWTRHRGPETLGNVMHDLVCIMQSCQR